MTAGGTLDKLILKAYGECDDPPKCTSCGKPFTLHEGIVGTCNRYQFLLASLRKIVTDIRTGERPPKAARELAVKIEAAMKQAEGAK